MAPVPIPQARPGDQGSSGPKSQPAIGPGPAAAKPGEPAGRLRRLFPPSLRQLLYSRERFSPAQFGSTAKGSIFNLYTSSVSVSHLLDVFGGTRANRGGPGGSSRLSGIHCPDHLSNPVGERRQPPSPRQATWPPSTPRNGSSLLKRTNAQITETQFKAGRRRMPTRLAGNPSSPPPQRPCRPSGRTSIRTQHCWPPWWGAPRRAGSSPGSIRGTSPARGIARDPAFRTGTPSPGYPGRRGPNTPPAPTSVWPPWPCSPSFTLSPGYGQSSTDMSTVMATGGNFWNAGAALAQPLLRGAT